MATERDTQARPGIQTLLSWVRDSYEFFADHRYEQWRDSEMYDGAQWTPGQIQTLSDMLGMQALTINRTFPTVNMLLGMQVLGQTDIVAKGRTNQDTDLGHIASESLKFVLDQNEGTSKIHVGFRGAVIPGFGGIQVLRNPDPRKESIKLAVRDWKYLWWDPHGTPWFDVDSTRYVFMQKWVDLHDLAGLFPEWKTDIEGYFYSSASRMRDIFPYAMGTGSMWEPYTNKEEWGMASLWVDKPRKRVMPVEMWYTIRQELMFAMFPDGRAYELNGLPSNEVAQLVTACQEVVTGYVPKMRVATFLGDLLLEDSPSPHGHDDFPIAPFVGYTDRFERPYGVPRQIRDMDIEVNKRRTTALAKLNAKTVIMEEGAVEDAEITRQEAMRPDGVIIMRKGKRYGEHFKIEEHKGDLAAQISLLQESEREIGEMIGANAEMRGTESNAITGVAIDKRTQRGATVTAPLFENLKRAKRKLGYLIMSDIQSFWKQEKVIRVTDRMRGTERLITINQAKSDELGHITVKNKLNDMKFDIVVTDDIFSDVLREKYANILIESTKRAAPEAVPLIMDVAFEMLDLPRKEFVLMRLRQAFGLDMPPDEDLDKEEVAKQIAQTKQAQQEQAQRVSNLEIEEQELKNEKLIAQIRKLLSQSGVVDKHVERADVDMEIAIIKENREDERLRLEEGKATNDSRDKAMDKAVKIAQIQEQSKARQQQQNQKQGAKPKAKGGEIGRRAEGGPVEKGKPYLVGEEGPEVVVPKEDGTVIPNKGGFGLREDGTRKGNGWLGPLQMKGGKTATEISMGVEINGKDFLIPSMVPTLNRKEVDYLLNQDELSPAMWETPIGKSIFRKAVDHAKKRLSNGESPFKD